ncbi:MAG: hypothetical protein H0T46_03545 [Deltaproteobacteria bacterium]|nr:hypothetical protein [Deltaproteobacteria bacterium]
MKVAALCVVLSACGASPPPAEPTAPAIPAVRSAPKVDEQVRRAELASTHRKLEEEQSVALAAGCDQPPPHAPRCAPSCYSIEPPDPRAPAKKPKPSRRRVGPLEVQHVVCEQPGDDTHAGPFIHADELDGARLTAKPVRGRFPKPHTTGTWEGTLAAALASQPAFPKSDVIRVTSSWRARVHPVTKARLRCVTVSHFMRSPKRPIDACGSDGSLACEASGDSAAHGINVVHYRLAEARTLQAAGKSAECQQASLEALAVARGMPRWRQYAQLNAASWIPRAGYRTRFDGVLDEDALFVRAAALGVQAEQIHVACGGAPGPKTTAEQEQSFHTCW